MNPDFADAFYVSGLYRMIGQGIPPDVAFDQLVATAALPAFQAMLTEFESTPAGRALLRQAIGYWDAEGLPCPWDNRLDLMT